METCPICLDELQEHHIIKTLSCNHKFHFNCFKKLVYQKNNFYISCPLCREINTCTEKPFKDDHKENIKSLLHQGIRTNKCVCMTKNGLQCKNKPILMNYGKCYIHNKNILDKKYYRLYSDYLYFIFCLNYNWLTLIYLIDVGKKIIIKFLNEDSQVHEILQYYYRYLNIKNRDNDNDFFMNGIYDYYDLEKLSRSWLDYCVNKNIII